MQRKQQKSGLSGFGIMGASLAAIIVIVVISGMSNQNKGSSATIRGDSAYIDVVVSSGSLKIAAFTVAEEVYKVAVAHPEAKVAVVPVRISGSGLSDKYGNPVSGNLSMGQISISNLDEIRRYKDSSYYSGDNTKLGILAAQIKQLQNAYLLE